MSTVSPEAHLALTSPSSGLEPRPSAGDHVLVVLGGRPNHLHTYNFITEVLQRQREEAFPGTLFLSYEIRDYSLIVFFLLELSLILSKY